MRFFEALANVERTGSKPINLLLGNGFSIDIHPKFKYSSLASLLQSKDLPIASRFKIDIEGLLRVCRTNDFEKALQGLLLSKELVTLYPNMDDKYSKWMAEDADNLRRALAAAVDFIHPERRNIISDTEYNHCRIKLERFTKIFTTNYDLLLEWTLQCRLRNRQISKHFNDGFKYYLHGTKECKHYVANSLPFTRSGAPGHQEFILRNAPDLQSIFYIHGAIHLFNPTGTDLIKIKGRKDDDDILLVKYLEKITEEGELPQIVAEADHNAKMETITKHGYLRDCYDALKSLTGVLFVYNHRTYEHDEHIANAIVTSRIHHVYYGYRRSLKNTKELKQIEAEIDDWTRQRSLLQDAVDKPPLKVTFVETHKESFWRGELV